MNRRRIIAFLMALLMLLSVCASCKVSHSESDDMSMSGMLFWEVSDAEGHLLYLLGSIHVGESSLYPLPKVIREAYNAADLL
ncbi:MAG: TraB/GumN family protein, partial [Clostridia bacterium]|nr:TraB/GumN family protein [Clostridia bacterium]